MNSRPNWLIATLIGLEYCCLIPLAESAVMAPFAFVGEFAAAYTGIEAAPADELGQRLETALAASMDELQLAERPLAAQAAVDVLAYARETQPTGTLPVTRLQVYLSGEAVVLDETAVANLELVQSLMGGKKAGSLLSILDHTKTATGGRLLRRWLLYPLVDVGAISKRHDAVEHLVEQASLRAELRDRLKEVYDLERLGGRLSLGVANPRDMGRLRVSLGKLPQLAKLLSGKTAKGTLPELLTLDKKLLKSAAAIEKDLALCHFAAFGTEQVRNRFQRGRLARSIRAEKRHDPAFGNRQRHALQHQDHVVINDLDIVDRQDCPGSIPSALRTRLFYIQQCHSLFSLVAPPHVDAARRSGLPISSGRVRCAPATAHSFQRIPQRLLPAADGPHRSSARSSLKPDATSCRPTPG